MNALLCWPLWRSSQDRLLIARSTQKRITENLQVEEVIFPPQLAMANCHRMNSQYCLQSLRYFLLILMTFLAMSLRSAAKLNPMIYQLGVPVAVVLAAYVLKPKMIMEPSDPKKISNARLALLAGVAILAGQVIDCQIHSQKNYATLSAAS